MIRDFGRFSLIYDDKNTANIKLAGISKRTAINWNSEEIEADYDSFSDRFREIEDRLYGKDRLYGAHTPYTDREYDIINRNTQQYLKAKETLDSRLSPSPITINSGFELIQGPQPEKLNYDFLSKVYDQYQSHRDTLGFYSVKPNPELPPNTVKLINSIFHMHPDVYDRFLENLRLENAGKALK